MRFLNDLADPVVWRVMGGMAVVFVLPAITILAIRDYLKRRWLRRYRSLRRLRGFEVKTPGEE